MAITAEQLCLEIFTEEKDILAAKLRLETRKLLKRLAAQSTKMPKSKPIAPNTSINHGIILAAGEGKRMYPLTLDTPKALLPVRGKAMIDHGLDHLAAHGVKDAVMTVHHMGEQVEKHVKKRKDIKIKSLKEETLLGTGGAVINAIRKIPALGDKPFFALNGDTVWLDGSIPALRRMDSLWQDDMMDALLLLQEIARAESYFGLGDYTMDDCGRLNARGESAVAPLVWMGVAIISPRLAASTSASAAEHQSITSQPPSIENLFQHASKAGRLYGVVHDGAWFNVDSGHDLAMANTLLDNTPSGTQANLLIR